MAAYEFVVRAVGVGDDEEEAWQDAWEHMIVRIQENDYDEVVLLDPEATQ